jgi:hypothetical protein
MTAVFRLNKPLPFFKVAKARAFIVYTYQRDALISPALQRGVFETNYASGVPEGRRNLTQFFRSTR